MNPLTARVVDEHGAPIPGALVFLTTANDADPTKPGQFQSLNPQITNGVGEIVFFNSPVTKSRIQIAATAAGYKPAESFDGHPLPTYDGSAPLTITLTLATFKKPFQTAPRFWKGANMCGSRIHGLPPVPGGASDASLVLSWFYDRYQAADRAKIRQAWSSRGYTHVLVSWPDSRAFGRSPRQFGDTCRELIKAGFYPCPMLYSKDFDPPDVPTILANIAPVLPVIVGLVPLVCIGWELSIELSPAKVQELTDVLAPQFTPAGTRVYVHFQQGYSSFEPDHEGATFAEYWNRNIGLLTGILHQRKQADGPWDRTETRYRYSDILDRFAGNFNCSPDSGFGHPFDCVGLELTAVPQFNGQMTEAEGDEWGSWVVNTPASHGPAGWVSIQGSGNGVQR